MLSVTALYVMIASPSDVNDARQVVYDAISSWNETNTRPREVALIPLRWETSAVPQLGGHPQDIINQQLVDRADIVIALFGSRLGQATHTALSGTAEEMTRANDAGKPVHVYFSNAGHPQDVDVEQLAQLRDFQSKLGGLYGTYGNLDDLKVQVWRAIDHDISNIAQRPQGSELALQGVDFLAQPGSERVPTTDNRGRLMHETKRWVDLTNRGDRDALEVTVEPADPESHFFVMWDGPTAVHSGQTRRAPMVFTMATRRPRILVRWIEGGENRSVTFDVG